MGEIVKILLLARLLLFFLFYFCIGFFVVGVVFIPFIAINKRIINSDIWNVSIALIPEGRMKVISSFFCDSSLEILRNH